MRGGLQVSSLVAFVMIAYTLVETARAKVLKRLRPPTASRRATHPAPLYRATSVPVRPSLHVSL
jgi:hypothetical protein